MLPRMRLSAPALLSALTLLAPLAYGEGPSRGIRLPFPAVSLGDDATGVEVNPGALGMLRGVDLQVLGSIMQSGVGGAGEGLFVASPIIGPLALGMGLQRVGRQTLDARIFED